MAQKKTFLVLVCAFIIQIVAYILIGKSFPSDTQDIAKELVVNLMKAPETIVRTRNLTSDAIIWSIIPWLLAGLIGGLVARSPQKGVVGGILATILALALFILVVLLLDGIGLSALLNTYGYTMVVGFIASAVLVSVGGALGGTLTQS